MALVGPRPEAPEIVRRHYTEEDLCTLQVEPGLTSPGTLYYYTHCEERLTGDAAGEIYVQSLLPLKLALDRVYIKKATLWYDVQLIVRTVVSARCAGVRRPAVSRPSRIGGGGGEYERPAGARERPISTS